MTPETEVKSIDGNGMTPSKEVKSIDGNAWAPAAKVKSFDEPVVIARLVAPGC